MFRFIYAVLILILAARSATTTCISEISARQFAIPNIILFITKQNISKALPETDEVETTNKVHQAGVTMAIDNSGDKTNPNQALIIRNKERMGTVYQKIRFEITKQLQQGKEDGVQISSGKTIEDCSDIDEILLLFPAEPINGLMGQFILGLGVQPAGPNTPGKLSLRQAWMVQNNGEFSVQLEMKASSEIIERWAYTRHPEVRQVYLALFDDPETVVEGQVFHQSLFPVQPSKPHKVGRELDWMTVKISLPTMLIEFSQEIDHCEILLEALDEKLTAKTGHYLQWSESLVKLESFELVASEVENRLIKKEKAFNVIVEKGDIEIIRRKRIRPVVQHSFTLIGKDGTKRAGTIGCSISEE